MPHPKATRPEDTEQENNIRYVALTRSKNKIVFAHEHYTEPKLATGEQAAGEDPPHALFDEETPDLLEGDVPDHILNPTPYWDQVESDGVTAGREYSPTPGSPNFNAPNFDEDLFSSWKDHVRALLKEAHERTPFDELEVIEKIEAALAAL
jgi:hypothetical protein